MVTIDATEFKLFFDRDQFSYGSDVPDIRDTDIDRAITEALAVFNQDLWPEETLAELALLYLTAHFLKLDTDAASGGAAPVFNQNSRSVGSVSESAAIPRWMSEGEFSFYSTTYYGQKFLMLAKPLLGGAVYAIGGTTLP